MSTREELFEDIETVLTEARKRVHQAAAGEYHPNENYEHFRLHIIALEQKFTALRDLLEGGGE